MTVSYIEQECPDCGELKVFQEFSSFTGIYRRCMECGYYESELSDLETLELGPLVDFDINNMDDEE